MEEVEGGREADHVPQDVAHAAQAGPLEAVLGNGIADILDGVVGNLEFVAVRIEQGAAGILQLSIASRTERGQRRVRRRASGRVEGRNRCRIGRRHRVGGNGPPHNRVLRAGSRGHFDGERK